jgi:hypothetical protein
MHKTTFCTLDLKGNGIDASHISRPEPFPLTASLTTVSGAAQVGATLQLYIPLRSRPVAHPVGASNPRSISSGIGDAFAFVGADDGNAKPGQTCLGNVLRLRTRLSSNEVRNAHDEIRLIPEAPYKFWPILSFE